MHPRLFRLTEFHQRIDDGLRRAQRRGDRPDVDRLRGLKARVKRLIGRFAAARARFARSARRGIGRVS